MQESKRRPKPYPSFDDLPGTWEEADLIGGKTDMDLADPYVNEASANPERAGNGCMIYRGAE